MNNPDEKLLENLNNSQQEHEKHEKDNQGNQQVIQQLKNQTNPTLKLIGKPITCTFGSRIPIANGFNLLTNTCLITTVVERNLYFINPNNMQINVGMKTKWNYVVTLKLSSTKFLASGFNDPHPQGSIQFFQKSKTNFNEIKYLYSLENPIKDTFALLEKNHQIISGGSSNIINTFDIDKLIHINKTTTEGQQEWVNDLINIDYNCFASSGKDRIIRAWDNRVNLCIKDLKCNDMIRCLCLSQQDNKIVFGGQSYILGVWNWLFNGVESYKTDSFNYGLDNIGHLYFSGGGGDTINIYDNNSKSLQKQVLEPYNSEIKSILNFQNKYIITGRNNRQISKYELIT